MPEIELKNKKHIYFVGIGGIGISAIARMFMLQGKNVSGSDRAESPITSALAKEGAEVFLEHNPAHIPPDADLLIYSVAVPEDNPERSEARKRGIPELSYPQVLGIISKEKKTIAVAGTHGKTTTTAMLSRVFVKQGLEPTVIVGSLLKEGGSNFLGGAGKHLIVEACEYKRSFLNLTPDVLIITNVEEDHLDYYKDLADIQSAFRELAFRIPKGGVLICDAESPNLKQVVDGLSVKVVDYKKVNVQGPLSMPGEHNVYNAQASVAAAVEEGLDVSLAWGAVSTFEGTWRRFERKGITASGAVVYDDYAHHPTEIRATLEGFRETFPGKKLIVVFQPHLYSRTTSFLSDFVSSLAGADEIFVLPIYAAREADDGLVSHMKMSEEINKLGTKAKHLNSFAEAEGVLKEFGDDSVIITMGAGDVYKVGEAILK
jgi:UDP-N-acetylmuramate--alanine ligase